MQKHASKIIFIALVCTLCIRTHIFSQDSVHKAESQRQVPVTISSPPAINNTLLTVPPVILTDALPPVRRPRRKKTAIDSIRLAALLQDSLKLIAQRDSLNKTDTSNKQNKNNLVVSDVPILNKSDNPFDKLRGETQDNPKTEQKIIATPTESPSLLNRQAYSKNFIFWLLLFVLLFMSFVIPFSRSVINNSYNALLSDTTLRQVFRENANKPGRNLAYYALYFLFWINLATFIFLLLLQKGYKFPFGQFVLFISCLAAVALTYLIKHILLGFIASVFQVKKEVNVYNFIIMIAGILGGLFLLPLNILIAFGPADLSQIFFYLAFSILVIMYVLRYLRSLSLTGSFLTENRFHFLLYLCSVEIAPTLILIKLITTQFGHLAI